MRVRWSVSWYRGEEEQRGSEHLQKNEVSCGEDNEREYKSEQMKNEKMLWMVLRWKRFNMAVIV